MGTALRDEANVARLPDPEIRKIAHAYLGIVEAHAVGTDQRDIRIERRRPQLTFEPDAEFFGGLREARSEEADARDFIVDAILEDSRCDLARYRADRVVGRLRDFRERLVVGHAHRLNSRDFIGIDLD